ncbi:MAG: hypothetical protein E7107_06860 [Prevotella sp.]|jgi:membrane-associated HD superfamily phosphohydrolase|nr:hypothetical protein [Prevotella sp.]
MKLLKLYNWIAGSVNDFARPFKQRENEELYKQAKTFWSQLENSSIVIILIFVFLGIALAAYYYKPYNDAPGRHYTLKHWIIFLLITFILTFLVTLGFEYFAVPPKLEGALMLETKIALGNAIYASVFYFVVSVVWCNIGPTNACRIFKI